MHESEWRDWVRQYLGGLEAQVAALRGLETRVDALEAKRREHEASTEGGNRRAVRDRAVPASNAIILWCARDVG
jgi:hypothetical protein